LAFLCRNASLEITGAMTYYTYFESPIEPLLLTADGELLTGLYLSAHRCKPDGTDWQRNDDASVFAETKAQLNAYFDGKLTEFNLPLLMHGTQFQKQVWEELKKIPYGSTISYKELAQRVGNPKGARAVGLANKHNPISIIVPCHRAIAVSGKLTGYSGGLVCKAALLELESSTIKRLPVPYHQIFV